MIFVEGIDGSGKTTLIKRLSQNDRFKVYVQPTGDHVGQRIRTLARAGDLNRNLVRAITLFAVDRYEQSENVIADLNAGFNVVMDRSHYTSAAYQASEHLSASDIIEANEEFFPSPDALIFLDVEPETGMHRVLSSTPENMREEFEKIDFLRKAAVAYEKVIEHAEKTGVKVVRIDANRDQKAVMEDAISAVF